MIRLLITLRTSLPVEVAPWPSWRWQPRLRGLTGSLPAAGRGWGACQRPLLCGLVFWRCEEDRHERPHMQITFSNQGSSCHRNAPLGILPHRGASARFKHKPRLKLPRSQWPKPLLSIPCLPRTRRARIRAG